MKRFISVVVSLMLVVMLCSCGAGDIISNIDTNEKNNGSEDSSVSFEVGKISDNKYTNGFLGIGCTLDSRWVFKTEDEMKEINNITFDMLDEDIKEQLENANIVYDMLAISENGSSININIENMGVSGALLSVESYITPQIDSLKTALEQMGLTEVTVEFTTFDFAGKSEEGLYVHGLSNGIVFEEAVIVIKRQTRFANITIATTENIDSILAYFYAI